MTARRALVCAALVASAVAAPAGAAPARCPRLTDVAGDASYGSLGKGSSDLDLHEVQIASGRRTLVLAVKLASMTGTATELRLGSRVDVQVSVRTVHYYFIARRSGDGTWWFTMMTVRTEPDGRPASQPVRTIGGLVDPPTAEVVFIADRRDFLEPLDGRVVQLTGARTYLGSDVSIQEVDRVDGSVDYRDRSSGCRRAD